MRIKMTEVQKAYLLGRNETFDGSIGTHMYLEFKYQGKIKKFETALNKVIEAQPMLRAKVKDIDEFEIEPNYYYNIKIHNCNNDTISEIRNDRRNQLSHKLYEQDSFPFFTIEALENVDTPDFYILLVI